MFNLSGKVALVTGSSRGLGLAIAELLSQCGCRVMLCSRSEPDLQQAQAYLRSTHPAAEILYSQVDLTDENSVERLFSTVHGHWGVVDICVNNAGMLKQRPIVDMTLAAWHEMINANLTSAFLCSRAMMRGATATQSKKAIVNISSLSGIAGVEKFTDMSAYIASKHAVVGLTESLAVEGASNNVAANCVAPGAINTRMFQENFPDYDVTTTPADIANQVLPFCNINNPALPTGEVLPIYCNNEAMS